MNCSNGNDKINGLFDQNNLAKDHILNKLLGTVVKEVKLYAENQIKHMKKQAKIGLALSMEKDLNKLLEMIVDAARAMSNADAGTLYIMSKDKKRLSFRILQNETLRTRMGGIKNFEKAMLDVPLYKKSKPNYSNVSSYVAITGKTINIHDVYKAKGFDFTGPKDYDSATGYRSKSMLVIPLQNHEGNIIGVLQLLNAKDTKTSEVVPFSAEYEDLIASLASQAAIALTNTQLIQDLKNLFYAFIKSIATAIDEKSPYTGGHINRMYNLTMMIAEKINKNKEGFFKDVFFNKDELEELRIAAWMHDVGKITTPEHIINKETRLHGLFDKIEKIEIRFNLAASTIQNDYLHRKIKIMQAGAENKLELSLLDKECQRKVEKLFEDLEFIKTCNKPEIVISDENALRIREIAKKDFFLKNKKHPLLTTNEVKNLSIKQGTLTKEERAIINNHATMTLKILKQLPFPKNFENVPEYASAHHEKIDGSGYPRGLTSEQMPLQSKIMAIADIFEALTAEDRPYKKSMKLSEALKVMAIMKEEHHIDPDIYDLFINSRVYYEYAVKEMKKEQIDMDKLPDKERKRNNF